MKNVYALQCGGGGGADALEDSTTIRNTAPHGRRALRAMQVNNGIFGNETLCLRTKFRDYWKSFPEESFYASHPRSGPGPL